MGPHKVMNSILREELIKRSKVCIKIVTCFKILQEIAARKVLKCFSANPKGKVTKNCLFAGGPCLSVLPQDLRDVSAALVTGVYLNQLYCVARLLIIY